ncbi:MAG: transposase [Planctomycetes bacterium]|nr:transposase [Planctomycetota bacterium]MCL4729113.1 transposase [Planctomycetota bacterium]
MAAVIDDEHNIHGQALAPGNKARKQANAEKLKHPPVILDAEAREIVHRTIEEVCGHRGWRLLAANVRTNHLHVVIAAAATVDKVHNDIKAYATRRLREAGWARPDQRVWTHDGSKHRLFTAKAVAHAVHYTLYEQDNRERFKQVES